MDFEYDALKAAHRTARLIRSPRGKPTDIMLDTLVVCRGTTNHHRAVEMLGSFKKGWQPATADREGAGVPDYKIIALPWILTNTDYWFMFDSKMKNSEYGIQYKESQPIELKGPNVVFKTDEIQYKATFMADIGRILWPMKKFSNSVELRVKEKLGQYRAKLIEILEGVTTRRELSFVKNYM